MLIVGLLLTLGARWLDPRHRVALVWTGALSYLGLIVLLEWQALRGQSVVRPDGATIVAFTVLALLTLGAAATVVWRARAHVASSDPARVSEQRPAPGSPGARRAE